MKKSKNWLFSLLFSLISFLCWQAVGAQEHHGPQPDRGQSLLRQEPPPLPATGNERLTPQNQSMEDGGSLNTLRRLRLQADRNAIRNGFQAGQRSGTESGGGGSLERSRFYKVINKAVQILRRQAVFKFSDGKEIDTQLIEDALRVTVLPVHYQLLDREGAPADLNNDNEQLIIRFNVPTWDQMSLEEKIQKGFHEAFGILRIADILYRYSSELQAHVSAAWSQNPPEYKVKKEFIAKSSVEALFQKAKANNENLVMSNQCEKYSPKHHGYCLIHNPAGTNLPTQTVYLIDGTPDILSTGDGTSQIAAAQMRIILDVPFNQLNFVQSMVEFDAGEAFFLNRAQCISRGHAQAHEIRPGHLCVIAQLPVHSDISY